MTFANTNEPYAGAGPLEGAADIVNSINEGNWYGALGSVLPTGLDALDVFESPTKALATSVIGWLLEHIGFLDSFLDITVGDSGAVLEAEKNFREAAHKLDGIAADQITAFGTKIDTYRQGASTSAQAFEKRVGPRGDELKTASIQCLGLADTMNWAGVVVSTLRRTMRELLAEFIWWVFEKAQLALALAYYTAGGSLATLTTETCVQSAKLAKALIIKVNETTTILSNLGFLLGKLATPLSKAYMASGMRATGNITSLSAADAAEQKVADHYAAEHPPVWPPQPKPYGPGLPVKWTASGTLDE